MHNTVRHESGYVVKARDTIEGHLRTRREAAGTRGIDGDNRIAAALRFLDPVAQSIGQRIEATHNVFEVDRVMRGVETCDGR